MHYHPSALCTLVSSRSSTAGSATIVRALGLTQTRRSVTQCRLEILSLPEQNDGGERMMPCAGPFSHPSGSLGSVGILPWSRLALELHGGFLMATEEIHASICSLRPSLHDLKYIISWLRRMWGGGVLQRGDTPRTWTGGNAVKTRAHQWSLSHRIPSTRRPLFSAQTWRRNNRIRGPRHGWYVQ